MARLWLHFSMPGYIHLAKPCLRRATARVAMCPDIWVATLNVADVAFYHMTLIPPHSQLCRQECIPWDWRGCTHKAPHHTCFAEALQVAQASEPSRAGVAAKRKLQLGVPSSPLAADSQTLKGKERPALGPPSCVKSSPSPLLPSTPLLPLVMRQPQPPPARILCLSPEYSLSL